MTTTRTPPPVSPPEQAIAPTGPPIRVRLPVGGWQVGFRIQPDGRTVIESADPVRDLHRLTGWAIENDVTLAGERDAAS